MAKPRYRLIRRENGTYYTFDRTTGERESLKTKNPDEADRVLRAKNESCHTSEINHQLGIT